MSSRYWRKIIGWMEGEDRHDWLWTPSRPSSFPLLSSPLELLAKMQNDDVVYLDLLVDRIV